MILTEERN